MNHIKRVYRSAKDHLLGGICGGLGQYFGVDSNLVRFIWVIITLIWPASIIAYFIMWAIIPNESDQEIVQAQAS